MKKLIILATVSTLSLGAYAVAQTPAELAAQFQSLQERVHAMTPEQRTEFKQMMREKMQHMSAEDKQLFKANKRWGKDKHCNRSDKRGWWDKARHKMNHVFDKERGDCQHGRGKEHYHDKAHQGKYCDHK